MFHPLCAEAETAIREAEGDLKDNQMTMPSQL